MARNAKRPSAPSGTRSRSKCRNNKFTSDFNPKSRLLSVQLIICGVLFLLVFLGNGVFPEKMSHVKEQILSVTTRQIDLRGALTRLGDSVAEGDGVADQLKDFCAEVFAPSEQPSVSAQNTAQIPVPDYGASEEVVLLNRCTDPLSLSNHYICSSYLDTPVQLARREPWQAAVAAQTPLSEPPRTVPAAGTLLQVREYSGKALPANYTMDMLSLGQLETVTPVLGHLNSEYGYREHPINGKYLFHGGVDIGGQTGDPIAAFASGTVDYVGENNSYGLYLQLDHGNGIKSFYAHCHRLCVKKGQRVEVGEKIAEVGSTGTSTGPHLHLELKYHDLHLDPAYYVEFLSHT